MDKKIDKMMKMDKMTFDKMMMDKMMMMDKTRGRNQMDKKMTKMDKMVLDKLVLDKMKKIDNLLQIQILVGSNLKMTKTPNLMKKMMMD
jgi:hypothetical protein